MARKKILPKEDGEKPLLCLYNINQNPILKYITMKDKYIFQFITGSFCICVGKVIFGQEKTH